MIKYIVESAKKAQNNRKDYEIFGRITLKIADKVPENVSIKNVISSIEKKLPEHILYDVDSIYLGNFKPLTDQNVDSLYISGTILVGPNHNSDKELFASLMHEFAHAVEQTAKDFIYGDGDVGREFLSKRMRLFNMLKDDYSVSKKQFSYIDYDSKLDIFFNNTIGYENLGLLTSGLFISPYGCTSLREYFANGFEHYFIENPTEIKKLCPAVFSKINGVIKGEHLY